jgi:hypothetical protein
MLVFGLMRAVLRQFEIAELVRIGVPAEATVTEVERRSPTTRMGTLPHQTMTTAYRYYLHGVATDPQTGATREFVSDSASWWTARRFRERARMSDLLDPHDPDR